MVYISVLSTDWRSSVNIDLSTNLNVFIRCLVRLWIYLIKVLFTKLCPIKSYGVICKCIKWILHFLLEKKNDVKIHAVTRKTENILLCFKKMLSKFSTFSFRHRHRITGRLFMLRRNEQQFTFFYFL